MRGILLLLALYISAMSTATPGYAAAPMQTSSPVLDAAQSELTRSFEQLRKETDPVYYLSYQIRETNTVTVSGSFGALLHSNENLRRSAYVDLRVGDYALDNTHATRGNRLSFSSRISSVQIPIENNPLAIRQALWRETDKRYKQAVEELTKARTNDQVQVEQEDKSADFSKEKTEVSIEPTLLLKIDRKLWEDKVRKYTAPFHPYGDIYDANATLTATEDTRWFVASDGTRLQTSQIYYHLFVSAFTKASDGMELPRYESFFSTTPQGLPDDTTILKAVGRMITDLHALRTAPVVDPYTGPAILSGRATAVFFHEVFGHRIEGHRQKDEKEGQTFKKMVGQSVLPDFLSVDFDPTLHKYGNTELVGSYDYDDEGVKARPVHVVEDGVFKGFLMSRSPIEGFPNSNGHGRAQAGFSPVARQSNLIIRNRKPMKREELKAMLIKEIKKEDKPFGLLFDDIQGGFTMTGRTIPNAFNVLPIMVYRVYPDGKEELVRGVDLIGTPLTVFSKIVAADDETAVFNGICGAESGMVPVSASGPAILVSQIEVQKKTKSQERAPILPAPFKENDEKAAVKP